MNIQSELLLILVLVAAVLVYAILIYFGKSQLRKEHILPLCLIPVFGLLMALMIEFMIRSGKQGMRTLDSEHAPADDEILWTTLKSFRERRDLVPLEEAVLIDEVKVRRRSMLETLYSDPFNYLAVLNTAKYNEDVETSHYATTTISRAQKNFQISIQRQASEVECHLDDPAALDAYIEMLGKYIQSGLLEENLLRNMRMVYAKALDRKLRMVKDDRNALTEKLRNAIELQDYSCASETSQLLREYWPEDEQTWIETLRVCVEGLDRTQLQEIIQEIQAREIIWTQQGREQVGPWVKA